MLLMLGNNAINKIFEATYAESKDANHISTVKTLRATPNSDRYNQIRVLKHYYIEK
jgi:hypothetical protein